MNKILLFIISSTLLAILFIIFPQIDIFVANLFYVPGRKFFLDEEIFLSAIHNFTPYITVAFIILWSVLIITTSIIKRPVWGLTRLRVIYLLLVLAIGPGLVVNVIFKDNWGRARPRYIDTFGGERT